MGMSDPQNGISDAAATPEEDPQAADAEHKRKCDDAGAGAAPKRPKLMPEGSNGPGPPPPGMIGPAPGTTAAQTSAPAPNSDAPVSVFAGPPPEGSAAPPHTASEPTAKDVAPAPAQTLAAATDGAPTPAAADVRNAAPGTDAAAGAAAAVGARAASGPAPGHPPPPTTGPPVDADGKWLLHFFATNNLDTKAVLKHPALDLMRNVGNSISVWHALLNKRLAPHGDLTTHAVKAIISVALRVLSPDARQTADDQQMQRDIGQCFTAKGGSQFLQATLPVFIASKSCGVANAVVVAHLCRELAAQVTARTARHEPLTPASESNSGMKTVTDLGKSGFLGGSKEPPKAFGGGVTGKWLN